jgi:hypothetical protein
MPVARITSDIHIRLGTNQAARRIPAIPPATSGPLIRPTRYLPVAAGTPLTGTVRLRATARLFVACSDHSGSPVTSRSSPNQATGPTAQIAAQRIRSGQLACGKHQSQ